MRIENNGLIKNNTLLDNKKIVNEEKSFGEYLSKALDEVNELQVTSKEASAKLAAGEIEDISQVVIAGEKASVAIQLTMQIRNKAVDAYQEVMRMQV